MRKKKAAPRGGSGRSEHLPSLCDLTCQHARFAPADAVGACRRDQAVYCARFDALNNKHTRCIGRKK